MTDFSLSATTLNAHLACYYEQLLFGTAAHRALEAFFRQAQPPSASGFGPVEELAALFRRYFARARFELPATSYQRLATAGPLVLGEWWAQAASLADPAVAVAVAVQAVLPGGVRLTGKLDRLDLQPAARRPGRARLQDRQVRRGPGAAHAGPARCGQHDAG